MVSRFSLDIDIAPMNLCSPAQQHTHTRSMELKHKITLFLVGCRLQCILRFASISYVYFVHATMNNIVMGGCSCGAGNVLMIFELNSFCLSAWAWLTWNTDYATHVNFELLLCWYSQSSFSGISRGFSCDTPLQLCYRLVCGLFCRFGVDYSIQRHIGHNQMSHKPQIL